MVPFSSQGGQYWGVGGLFGPPAEKFGMTSTTFFLPSCMHGKFMVLANAIHMVLVLLPSQTNSGFN
jgi:hypothetical protein